MPLRNENARLTGVIPRGGSLACFSTLSQRSRQIVRAQREHLLAHTLTSARRALSYALFMNELGARLRSFPREMPSRCSGDARAGSGGYSAKESARHSLSLSPAFLLLRFAQDSNVELRIQVATTSLNDAGERTNSVKFSIIRIKGIGKRFQGRGEGGAVKDHLNFRAAITHLHLLVNKGCRTFPVIGTDNAPRGQSLTTTSADNTCGILARERG